MSGNGDETHTGDDGDFADDYRKQVDKDSNAGQSTGKNGHKDTTK